MTDVDYSLSVFKHIGRRSILPLLLRPGAERDADLPDLSNLQGDVVYLFPKVTLHVLQECEYM
jgi:hypothetical protein